MAPAHKFCNRCNRKHAAPTGKRKCRLPLPTDDFADENSFGTLVDVDVDEEVLGAASDDASATVSEPQTTPTDIQADTLTQILSVVSLLAGKVEATQQQVAVLQADRQSLHRSQGAIPKNQRTGNQASAPPPGACMPQLDTLRSDAILSAQAAALVDNLDMGVSGSRPSFNNNFSNTGNSNPSSGNGSTKRGWARPGGDNAPKVCTPWPQDFVVGHGRRNRLLFDDLDVFQFVQGCISMIERQSDVDTMRLMLSQLRSTMRDASFHGFESARYAFGTILSMLEDGALTWADQYQMAEERRSALIARGSAVRDPPSRETGTGSRRAGAGGGGNGRRKNSGTPGHGGPRPCIYHNNGQCAQRGDHTTNGVTWKHVCRRCWATEHVEKDCPLGHSGTSP
jgi:hypothetical protein